MYRISYFLSSLYFFLLQNRFYVETKLKTDLNEELLKLFRAGVVDTHISLLLCKYAENQCYFHCIYLYKYGIDSGSIKC